MQTHIFNLCVDRDKLLLTPASFPMFTESVVNRWPWSVDSGRKKTHRLRNSSWQREKGSEKSRGREEKR